MALNNSETGNLSVVIIALNERDHLCATVECVQRNLPPGSEIIVVDDGSTDGCSDFLNTAKTPVRLVKSNNLGISKARNFGARLSTGKMIVFADAHISVPPAWWQPIAEVLKDRRVGAVGPAIVNMQDRDEKGYGLHFDGPKLDTEWLDREGDAPYQVPLLCGCFCAMRRDVFDATGGFDEGLTRWGSDDGEMSLRLWLLGYELWVVPRVEVAHLFRSQPPYSLEWPAVLHNTLRLAFVHFGADRINQVLEALRDHEGFSEGLAQVIMSDFSLRRSELMSSRMHGDEWFFRRFGLDW
jgi:GT2 family glycosyltransferase